MVEFNICDGGLERNVGYGDIACNFVFHYNFFHPGKSSLADIEGKGKKSYVYS